MTATVAQMTKGELREMIEASVERKLLELLGDPDEGLPIRKAVRDRLLRQQQAVSAWERGEPLEDVVRRVGWSSHRVSHSCPGNGSPLNEQTIMIHAIGHRGDIYRKR